MSLVDSLSKGNEGNAEGLQARQQALRDIGNGALKNTSAPSSKPAAPTAPVKPNPKTEYGTRPGEKRIPDSELNKYPRIAGSYKKGGKVKRTAVYKLHKGERVLNPKQTKKAEKGGLMAALKGAK